MWETNWLQRIYDGEEAFDEIIEPEEENIEPEPKSAKFSDLDVIHQNLNKLKEFSLFEGHSDLFVSTQKTISNLEWIISSGKSLRQPCITSFFRRSI